MGPKDAVKKQIRQIVVLACYFFLTHTLAVAVRIFHRRFAISNCVCYYKSLFFYWILSSIYECYNIFISVCFCQIVSKSLNGILTVKKKQLKNTMRKSNKFVVYKNNKLHKISSFWPLKSWTKSKQIARLVRWVWYVIYILSAIVYCPETPFLLPI